MTDAHPPSLQHELQLSFKDFIVGYPTQTGSLLATLRLCVSIFHHILWHAPLGAPNVDISLQSGRFWATSFASFRETGCWILKTKQERPQRRLLGGESAVEGDRISPLESHRQPLEQVRCFPGVFSDVIHYYYYVAIRRDHIKCCTLSICPSITCLQFSQNRKAVETSNLVITQHWPRVTKKANLST